MMTAKTVARDRTLGRTHTPVTALNIKKVTQFRGQEDFEKMVQKFLLLDVEGEAPKNEASMAEKEAESLADESAVRAKKLADGIVSESAKKGGQSRNQKDLQ